MRPFTSSTRGDLLDQCDEAAKNIERFASWVASNQWLDQTKVELVMPWLSYICFDCGSRALLTLKLGGEGWTVGMSGEIRKTVEEITVAVAGELK